MGAAGVGSERPRVGLCPAREDGSVVEFRAPATNDAWTRGVVCSSHSAGTKGSGEVALRNYPGGLAGSAPVSGATCWGGVGKASVAVV